MKNKDKNVTRDQLGDLLKIFGQAVGVPTQQDAQMMLEQSNLGSRLREVLDQAACYPAEQSDVTVGYPEGYPGPRPLIKQVEILAERFSLDPTNAFKVIWETGDKHKCAEGWFAAVNWKVLGDDYMEQCWKVFDWIREYSKTPADPKRGHGELGMFSQDLIGKLNDEQIGFHPSYNNWRSRHPQSDKDPIWIFPAQFGFGRAGQSHRRAVELCKRTETEYPLSIFEVACMIAVHPERLGKGGYGKELHAVCPGSVEIPKPDALYHDGLDGRHFDFYGVGAVTVNKYDRYCSFVSNTSGSLAHMGPVTAWTWQRQER